MIHLKNRRHSQQRPRLDRRNAMKNIDHDVDDGSSTLSFMAASLDQSRVTGTSSFRIEGIEGEVDEVFRSLGLGLEDFSIPLDAWEARKTDSSPAPDLLIPEVSNPYEDCPLADDFRPGSRDDEIEDGFLVIPGLVNNSICSNGGENGVVLGICGYEDMAEDLTQLRLVDTTEPSVQLRDSNDPSIAKVINESIVEHIEVNIGEGRERKGTNNSNGMASGIRVCRPQNLALPPVMMHSVVDTTSSTWDLMRSFGPQDDHDYHEVIAKNMEKERAVNAKLGSEERNCPENIVVEENNFIIPRSGSLRRTITSWQKGDFLGSGSFGTVYEGFTDDGFFFAVKEVSLLDKGCQGQQSISQLEQEVWLLRQFQHENIVRYIGTDKDDSKLYIFLELVTKGSLAKLYQKFQLQDSQVCAYTRQILYGLDYLHSRNVVHRDIKCANILVDASGAVKLADFGLAKITELNDIQSCKGTPYWMAPEVVKNRGYGRAADIWSLGCTVLEMLTRKLPYSHLEGMQALFRIGRGELPRIPTTLSKDARDFILQCLRVNPDDRPTAAQLLDHPFVKKPPRSNVPSLMHPHSSPVK